ncbi:UNVERIFIED_CONTAM: hypothetical protein HDU68_005773 [Siphonaria sp. JEL0065]|nr:hypothetical protein HDU68_005773 [Siphonaria sp. JEL0065]
MPPKRKTPHTDDIDAASSPEERRAIQVRLAQRAFRQRREDRIKAGLLNHSNLGLNKTTQYTMMTNPVLEARLEELAQTQALNHATAAFPGGVAPCTNCERECRVASEYLAHIRQLEERVSLLQAEYDQLRKRPLEKRPASTTTTATVTQSGQTQQHDSIPLLPLSSLAASSSQLQLNPGKQFQFYSQAQTAQQFPVVFGQHQHNTQEALFSASASMNQMLQHPFSNSSFLLDMASQQPQQQQQQLMRPIITDYSSLNSQSLNLLGSTASERLGHPPQVEWVKQALLALPSLANCEWVNVMFDTFVARCDEKETVRNACFKILAAKYKIFDTCSPQDLPKAIELIEAARESNRVHLDYMYEYAKSCISPFDALRPVSATEIIPQVERLKQRLLTNVASFGQNHELVLELCALFSVQVQCTEREKKAERLLQLVALKDKLARLCVDQAERVKFIMEIEKFRTESQDNRMLVKQMFQGVMTESSCLLQHDL